MKCKKCNETRSPQEFAKCAKCVGGLAKTCKICNKTKYLKSYDLKPRTKENRQLAESGLKKCKICENIKDLGEFYPIGDSYYSSQCKKCAGVLLKNRYKENTNGHRDRAKSLTKKNKKDPEKRFKAYKAGAENRNILFNITFEQFYRLWQRPCSYCASPIETIGVDRIDNEKGYSVDNICSCCSTCNYWKKAQSQEFFISHAKKIAANSP